jgi:hypothetical protein
MFRQFKGGIIKNGLHFEIRRVIGLRSTDRHQQTNRGQNRHFEIHKVILIKLMGQETASETLCLDSHIRLRTSLAGENNSTRFLRSAECVFTVHLHGTVQQPRFALTADSSNVSWQFSSFPSKS